MSNEEFENLFGNVPFEKIRKINEYIDKNFISKQVIRDKIKELEDNTCIYCGGECVKIDGDYWEVGGIFKVLKSIIGE